ncbi:MAG: PilZ domain-containing protein [Armatimonadetes bacterium]|nr:PilZ domain-containing protein [Armatimonadota bacterium]
MLQGLMDKLRNMLGSGGRWAYEERRRLNRISCDLEVEIARGDLKYQARVTNMSLSGMGLCCHGALKSGDRVTVRYLAPLLGAKRDRVACSVVWSRSQGNSTVVGVIYEEDEKVMAQSWVKSVLREIGFGNGNISSRRKAVRADCYVPVKCTLGGRTGRTGTLYNLGSGGALVELEGEGLAVGTALTLHIGPFEKLPRLNAPGTITAARSKGTVWQYGFEFSEMNARDGQVLEQYLSALLRIAR